jgi:protein-tyrosine-phosphatase
MGSIGGATAVAKKIIRKLMPQGLLKDRYIYGRLGRSAGLLYLRLRLLDMAGVRTQNAPRVPANAKSLAFVCFGNVMRSAMAEVLLSRALRELGRTDLCIISAGLHACEGTPAHPWAQLAVEKEGVSLLKHRARILTQEMVSSVDAIVVMDFQNKAELLTQYPHASAKIFMISTYADPPWKNREIPDPFFGSEESTLLCCKELDICVRRLLATLEV